MLALEQQDWFVSSSCLEEEGELLFKCYVLDDLGQLLKNGSPKIKQRLCFSCVATQISSHGLLRQSRDVEVLILEKILNPATLLTFLLIDDKLQAAPSSKLSGGKNRTMDST